MINDVSYTHVLFGILVWPKIV